jgi:hypothetical protein
MLTENMGFKPRPRRTGLESHIFGQVSGPYFDETFYSLFEHVKNFPNPPQ